jgi:Zn-dependent protease with chaperone function
MSEVNANFEGDAVYFDGANARRRRARLRLGAALEIHEDDRVLATWPWDTIRRADGPSGMTRLSSRAAAELARLEIADADFGAAVRSRCPRLDVDGAPNSGHLGKIVFWSLAAAASITLIAIYGAPAIAVRLTPLIPRSVEARIGDAVANQVDGIFGNKRCEGQPGHAALARLSGELAEQGGLPDTLSVEVRKSPVANAFAIPGDRVYIFSALIEKADNADELAGVLAHEFGHVAHRDGLREMLSRGGSAFMLGLLLGDVSGSGAILFAGRTLLGAAHSREAESNADAFAAKTLLGLGRSPARLGEFLLRLTGEQSRGAIALLASHPLSQDRLAELKRQDHEVTGRPLLSPDEWRALKAICAGR